MRSLIMEMIDDESVVYKTALIKCQGQGLIAIQVIERAEQKSL